MQYIHRTDWKLGVASVAALLLAACGGSSGGGGGGDGDSDGSDEDSTATAPGSFETEKVGFETEEDFNPSVGFFTSDDGGLGIRVNGLDADDDDEVDEPEVKNVTIEEGDTTGDSGATGAVVSAAEIETECVDVETGEAGGEGDSFDIGVSLDTTGSMGGASGVLASRIAGFATELEDRGLNVKFAGITLGDAYATKFDDGDNDTPSTGYEDSISAGTLGQPPNFGFGPTERPDTGTSLLDASEMTEFSRKCRPWSVLG